MNQILTEVSGFGMMETMTEPRPLKLKVSPEVEQMEIIFEGLAGE